MQCNTLGNILEWKKDTSGKTREMHIVCNLAIIVPCIKVNYYIFKIYKNVSL